MSAPPGLPAGVAAYRRTPVFDEHTMPAALRNRHSTKAGVWALITVVEGRLRFRSFDPPSETVLDPDKPGVAAPEQLHEVMPEGPTRFYVEFCSAPRQQAGPGHENRTGSQPPPASE